MNGNRAIAYGRKSFDDPDRKTSSVADQRHFAEAYAERHSLRLLAFHGDDGITGATMERPGLQAMLDSVRRGEVDVLVVEDVDRLGRDQEHLQHMMKIFRLHQVAIHTVAAGVIDDLVFAFKGIIGEQQRKRIAYTTRRGLKGKAQRGGATGGRTLGYAKEVFANGSDGSQSDRLAIRQDEAELVRRIFSLYADGAGLKAVCAILNAEGIPSPRARETGAYNAGVWNPTTLSGDPSMGEGILNNEIYIGRRIFNRRTWVEVPNERRGFSRKPRLNPVSEWVIRDEPELRIVDQALWDRVKARQAIARAERDKRFKLSGRKLGGGREREHLLSGLVECGACGRPFLATGGGRWRCKGARTSLCDNGSVTGRELETRALAGIKNRLLTPATIAGFADALQTELREAWRNAQGGAERASEQLGSTRSRIAKILARLEEDDDAPRSLMARLKELEAEEEALAEEVARAATTPVVRLPTNYEAVYRKAVADLGEHLGLLGSSSSRQSVRTLITRVVVHAGSARGGRSRPMELHGDLYRMLEFAHKIGSQDPAERREDSSSGVNIVTGLVAGAQSGRDHNSSSEVVTGLVAGTGFEPVTFRL